MVVTHDPRAWPNLPPGSSIFWMDRVVPEGEYAVRSSNLASLNQLNEKLY
jgi:hypothetical protein